MDSSARFILSNADLGNTPTIVLVIYLIILFGLGVLGSVSYTHLTLPTKRIV